MNTNNLFFDRSLDEDSDPSRRLCQALEEAGITSGPFRDAVVQGLAHHLDRVGIDRIDNAVRRVSDCAPPREQMVAFVAGIGRQSVSWKGAHPHPLVVAAARLIFQDSPLELWRCFFDGDRPALLSALPELYGRDIFLQSRFFEDEASVRGGGPDAPHEYVLHSCCCQHLKVPLPSGLQGQVIPNLEDYVGAWHQSLASRSVEEASRFRYGLPSRSREIVQHLLLDEKVSEQLVGDLKEAFRRMQGRLIATEVRHAPLDSASNIPIEWQNALLLEDLSASRVAVLIERTLDDDIRLWKRVSTSGDLFEIGRIAARWYVSPHRHIWLQALHRRLDGLGVPERLQLVRHCFPPSITFAVDQNNFWPDSTDHIAGGWDEDESQRYWTCDVDAQDIHDWNDALGSLRSHPDFDQTVLPAWIEAAHRGRRLDLGSLVESAVECLGRMRTRLAAAETNWSLSEYRASIEVLAGHAPDKLLRALLLAFRFCALPSVGSDLTLPDVELSECFYDKLEPHQAIVFLLNQVVRRRLVGMDYEADVSSILAEYCVARLKLRKGEKANTAGYASEQCIDPSPVWRQAYLKALKDLNCDLGGKVHRTAFFVRKHDPDEDVRKTAVEAYKASRRSKGSEPSAAERGAVAATWWLRLAQRSSLEKEVDVIAARRTRRRELRAVNE